MQELTFNQVQEVNGGSAGQIAGAAITGAVSGFFGGVVLSAGSRIASAMFGSYAVGTGVAASQM